jgi:hypothetical protein
MVINRTGTTIDQIDLNATLVDVSGDLSINGGRFIGSSKEIFRYSDAWLRINEDNDFTSGIYCGSGILRTDGEFQCGASGVDFKVTTAGVVTIASTCTATNFILSSDKRLKSDIEDLDIPHIPVNWKSFKMGKNSQVRYGLIAQELEVTNPELVRTDDKGMKSVAYIDLLVAKAAENDKEIKELKDKMAEKDRQIESLEKRLLRIEKLLK